jgi:hypothetical protein
MYRIPSRQCLASLRIIALKMEDRVTNQNLTPLLAKVVVNSTVNYAILAAITFGLVLFSREHACRLVNLSCVIIDA